MERHPEETLEVTHFPPHHKEPEVYHKQADGDIQTDQALPY